MATIGVTSSARGALYLVLGAALGCAGVAVATVPDSSGVIHACYQKSDRDPTVPQPSPGNLRIIDPDAGQTCDSDGSRTGHTETGLHWNVAGPPGPQGAPGTPGTQGAQGSSGDGVTIAPPPIRSNAPNIGSIRLTTGSGTLTVPFLEQDLAQAKGDGAPHDLVITRTVDKSSSKLFLACARGDHYDKAKVTMRKAGKGQQDFLIFQLKDVIITGYQTRPGAKGTKSRPQETVSLSFTKIELQ
jgi:type VI secretion system Hcp family effector